MLDTAKARGFMPACVVFDNWFASLPSLKAVRGHGWRWITQLNRQYGQRTVAAQCSVTASASGARSTICPRITVASSTAASAALQ